MASNSREYHVSPKGSDASDGSPDSPLKTISAAAKLAQTGDTITVHAGTYRERVNPPRGGESDAKRITYQAAQGERVEIKGSEVVTGWKRMENGAWEVTLPESFFGGYNPYRDVISGDWFVPRGRQHHTGEVFLNGAALSEAAKPEDLSKPAKEGQGLWFCDADETSTTILAQFGDTNPNASLVEISVRETCFYPDQPGRDYITVRGFRMSQAATQWAAPTAEQVGLLGVHWSKGWIIEDCVISDSKCVGITLGKDRASGQNQAESAPGYTDVVRRALKNGWSKEKIGSHIVRNNTILNCGAAGICGSMGAAFSQVYGNHIHHINLNKPFDGAEQAGIKFHAAIDTIIRDNYIHHCNLGIWLDWMAQGTRVTANVLHDNAPHMDLFVEVNHGPFLADNNLFLSRISLWDVSEGGAFAHNLFAGELRRAPEPGRETPFHPAHTTEIAGLIKTRGGDHRFYNNIFTGPKQLEIYDDAELPIMADGNVSASLQLKIEETQDGIYLDATVSNAEPHGLPKLVTSSLLGNAHVSGLPYVTPDDSPITIDTDYFGKPRDKQNPAPGPVEKADLENLRVKVWPKKP